MFSIEKLQLIHSVYWALILFIVVHRVSSYLIFAFVF